MGNSFTTAQGASGRDLTPDGLKKCDCFEVGNYTKMRRLGSGAFSTVGSLCGPAKSQALMGAKEPGRSRSNESFPSNIPSSKVMTICNFFSKQCKHHLNMMILELS